MVIGNFYSLSYFFRNKFYTFCFNSDDISTFLKDINLLLSISHHLGQLP